MEPSPRQQMGRMLTGYWVSQALHVAARLKLADLVADEPKTADELATSTQTHAPSLYRLLRALASLGVFAEGGQGRFGLTPMAECLRSDVPGSQWASAMMIGEGFYLAWGELLHCVRTGGTGFEKIYGRPVFDHLASHPEQAALFDQAMISFHGHETAAMVEAYDFAGVRRLVDVGGGNGTTLAGILSAQPAMRGTLFDLPGVVERAREHLKAAGVLHRCEVVAGSFFDTIPAGADAYLLRHIIHDWDDDQSLQILRHVRSAIAPAGRLLVVETVIEPGNEPSIGKLLDLAMLVLPGGMERTSEEYRRLYERAGFRLTRVVPTAAEVSVVEGAPA